MILEEYEKVHFELPQQVYILESHWAFSLLYNPLRISYKLIRTSTLWLHRYGISEGVTWKLNLPLEVGFSGKKVGGTVL